MSENLSLVLQLFLDDSVRNIIAGKETGLHTVLVILLTKVNIYLQVRFHSEFVRITLSRCDFVEHDSGKQIVIIPNNTNLIEICLFNICDYEMN